MSDIQKPSLWKRLSAYLFDIILLVIVAVGCAFLLTTLLGYDATLAEREALRADYETRYGVTFDITQEEYDALTEEGRAHYEDAYRAFASDPAVNEIDLLIVNLTLIIVVFSGLVAFLIFEFFLPLWLGNGQTLGKKIFGVGVMRVDGVRISVFQLFVRAILGKYTLETMIPVFLFLLFLLNILPLACLVGMAILFFMQVAFLLSTELRTPIHDMIAGTATVDFASQMIFDSVEEQLAYKKRMHAEEASRAEYR